MPELPEVETVARGLSPVLVGARLTRVEARRPDLRYPLPVDFVQHLTGARVLALTRRAKYLLAPLDRGRTLLMHLGMTGRFEIAEAAGDPGSAPAKHAHVLIETERGTRITFFDTRRFGFMDLIDDEALAAHPRLAGLGPEPLGEAFDAAYLGRAFSGRRQNVKTLLLDQRVVAGLGNIYVCEALFRAGISPVRAAGAVSRRRLAVLVEAVRGVLVEAMAAGGSTLRDFAAADGQLGYFQHSFQVYGRAGGPCARPACGGVVRRLVQGGRSSFYCPVCQK
jgi:formamidopyrimidine-DNA glycosylase